MSSPPSPLSGRSAPDLAHTLGAVLRSPYRRLQKQLYREMERRFPDIRRAHSVVFRHVAEGGSRLTDLAEQAEMTKQSMAYLVGHLAAAGYVKTGKHPDDGRAVLVKLTAKGRTFIAAALEASADLEKEAAMRVGGEKMTQLRHLLVELDGALEADDLA